MCTLYTTSHSVTGCGLYYGFAKGPTGSCRHSVGDMPGRVLGSANNITAAWCTCVTQEPWPLGCLLGLLQLQEFC